MKRKLIRVDEDGLDENGEGFDLKARPEAVASGLMINVPVTLIFPDGRKLDTYQVQITPKGLQKLKGFFAAA